MKGLKGNAITFWLTMYPLKNKAFTEKYWNINPSCLLLSICRKPFGSCKIRWKPSGKAQKLYLPTPLNLGPHLSRGESSCKCTCLASLADFDGVAGSGWVPIGDQVLLMASIFLTYMAGVIPVQNSSYSSRKKTVEENPDVGTSESSGR